MSQVSKSLVSLHNSVLPSPNYNKPVRLILKAEVEDLGMEMGRCAGCFHLAPCVEVNDVNQCPTSSPRRISTELE
jgi:hypothetical protein